VREDRSVDAVGLDPRRGDGLGLQRMGQLDLLHQTLQAFVGVLPVPRGFHNNPDRSRESLEEGEELLPASPQPRILKDLPRFPRDCDTTSTSARDPSRSLSRRTQNPYSVPPFRGCSSRIVRHHSGHGVFMLSPKTT